MMRKRAQLQQVFIYIMAIIVIGFLVLLGYRAINDIFEKKCNVEIQQFALNTDHFLDVSSKFGTVKKATINAPCSYTRVCFVDASYVIDGRPLSPDNRLRYPIIHLNTDDKIAYNIYLIKPDVLSNTTFPISFDDRITTIDNTGSPSLDEEILCVDQTGGTFSFWLEGRGKEGIYLYDNEE